MLAIIFIVDGFWSAWRSVGSAPARAAAWAGWGTLVPLAVLASLWVAFGNLDRDFGYAAAALVLTALFIAGGEAIARREAPPLKGGLAVSFAFLGAGVAAMLMLHMALGPLWTTMLAGALAVVPALATRIRTYPVLGWLSVGAVLVVLGRIVFDPTIVARLRTRQNARLQRASARLRRAGARLRLRRLAARPHHGGTTASRHGGGGRAASHC